MSITYNALITPSHIFQDDGGVFSANKSGAAAFDYFPDNVAVNDALYFGNDMRFDDIQVQIGTAFAAASATFAWEYYNGSSWVPLTVTDGTVNWTSLGVKTIAFLPPDDWRDVVINTVRRMWIRCRVSAVNTPTEGGANATSAVQVGNNLTVVSGYTSGSPCTFAALSAALPTIWPRVGANSFLARSRLQIGSDDSDACYFIDTLKIIEFCWFVYLWGTASLVNVKAAGTFRLGTLLDGANKIGGDGCFIGGNITSAYNIIGGNAPQGIIELFGCSIIPATAGMRLYINNPGGKIYNCLFGNDVYITNAAEADLNFITFLKPLVGLSYPSNITMNNLTFYLKSGGGVAGMPSGAINTVATNSNFYGVTVASSAIGLFYSYSTVDFEAINCNANAWVFWWQNGSNVNRKAYRKYTIDLKVVGSDGTAINGATVTIKDNTGANITGSPFTTGADGKITTATAIYSYFKRAAAVPTGNTYSSDETVLSPFTITITKTGYQDYQDVITIDRKMDLEVALGPVHVPVPSGELDISLVTPELLSVALESDEVKVELSDDQ